MWRAAAFAEAPDLTPLLPAPTPDTQAIREALLAGDVKGAARLVESLDPRARLIWRGILAILGNDSPAAIRALRHADEPKLLGVAYYLARQYLLFRDQMVEAIRRNPDDFGPYYYLGRYYSSDLDNAEEAERWLREAVRRNPSFQRARAHLGNCLELLGRTDEAEAEYRASVSMPLSQLGLARLRLGAGDAAGALALVNKAQAGDPLNAAAPKLAARVYSALNRPQDSIHSLETAAALDSRDASTQYQLYRAYQSLADPVKAASALREFERLRAVYGLQPR
jgi:tetratricopeptide (TPR) repeat protein